MRQVFTFPVNNRYRDRYIVFEGNTRAECRQKMFNTFGSQWSMQYDSEKDAGVDSFKLTPLSHSGLERYKVVAELDTMVNCIDENDLTTPFEKNFITRLKFIFAPCYSAKEEYCIRRIWKKTCDRRSLPKP